MSIKEVVIDAGGETSSVVINAGAGPEIVEINQGPVGPQGPPGIDEWGEIDGTLADQTDLQAALDAKLNLSGGVMTGVLTVGSNTYGNDVQFWGATASKYTLWDASQDKLIITGDLQVDGTTTTIKSTVVTIEDPVFTLGGATAPTTSDSKDRGIEFHYYDTDASAGKKGFFGWGNSDNAIKFLLNCADPSGSEIFTGDPADIHVGNIVLPDDGIIRNSHTDRAFIKMKTWSLDFFYDAKSMLHLQYANAIFNSHSADRDFIVHTTSANSLFVEGSSGNVGIGTATPAYTLHLNDADSPTLALQCGGVGTRSSTIRLIEGSANFQGAYMNYDGITNHLHLGVHDNNNTTLGDDFDAITIDRATGYVGINDTTPTQRLEVNGQIQVQGGGAVYFRNSGSQIYSADTNQLAFATGGSESMRINSYGQVGIGTASPEAKLEIQATSGASIFLRSSATNESESSRIRFAETTTTFQGGFIHYDGSSNLLNIGVHPTGDETIANDINAISIARADGNVGIGTDSPDYLLDVEQDSETYAARIFNDGNDQNRDVLLLQGGSDLRLGNTKFITFADGNGTETAWIQGAVPDANGGLAINTTCLLYTSDAADE